MINSMITKMGTRISYGSYTGNATLNKAIAHGLGKTPKLVIIENTVAGANIWVLLETSTYINYVGGSTKDVTSPTSVYFYVGDDANSANANLAVYNWVAIG